MVVDEKSTGPYTLDEVILHPSITPETLVWKPGLENWMPAKTFPELAPAFTSKTGAEPQTPPDYSTQQPNNPFANNPQYRENHTYQNQNPFNRTHNPYAHQNHHGGYQNQYDDRNLYYDPHDPHDPRNQYQNGYRPNFRTNWLPWAIVATVLGFFTSCIGAIFGIIGIVQANKANTFYAQGYEREGDSANSNARIMTIIGLIFAALGIIFAFTFGNYFASFANL